jgi:hypothetical protein
VISLTRREASARDAEPKAEPATRIEKTLIALGIDARVVSSTLGDLAEELAERSERDGFVRARLWWVREAIRSLPHMARYGIMYSHRTRVVFAATTVLLAIAASVATRVHAGPPAQIVLDGPTLAGTFVLNDTRSAQIPARIVDDRGHALPSRQLHYVLRSGKGVAVSPTGAVSCTSNTDAVVSASVESIVTSIPVACRIVRELRATRWLTLIAGADARPLPFAASGTDGESVRQLRGAMRVDDSTIAMVDGGRVRPIQPGETTIEVEVARHTARTRVFVHALIEHFTDRTPNQRFVAVLVHVGPAAVQRIAVPVGAFWLTYVPRREGTTTPTIVGDGPIRCTDARGLEGERFSAAEHTRYCTATSAGAAILVSAAGAVIDGALALELEAGPRAAP